MSSSDRNVGSNEVFDNRRPGGNIAAQAEELPSERIEVRINLNQDIVSAELRRELEENNMAVTESMIIIISGIPPVNGFGAQRVLEIVRQYAPNAALA